MSGIREGHRWGIVGPVDLEARLQSRRESQRVEIGNVCDVDERELGIGPFATKPTFYPAGSQPQLTGAIEAEQ